MNIIIISSAIIALIAIAAAWDIDNKKIRLTKLKTDRAYEKWCAEQQGHKYLLKTYRGDKK